MSCSARAGCSTVVQQLDMSRIICAARSRMASSCCPVSSPSGDTSPKAARNLRSRVATRTMKNSSRFVATIDRNFTRSSSGWVGSSAWSRTRWLNSSQLSSRLM